MLFPREIVIGGYEDIAFRAAVKVCPIPGGVWSRFDVDGAKREILINEELGEFAQHVAFLVHLIRFAEHIMSGEKDARELSRDDYRDGLAFHLFTMLSENGLWAGLSRERARSMFDAMAAETSRSAQRNKRLSRKPRSAPSRRRRAERRKGGG
jgi:hypothetical protein